MCSPRTGSPVGSAAATSGTAAARSAGARRIFRNEDIALLPGATSLGN
jgi:hypothetical protein